MKSESKITHLGPLNLLLNCRVTWFHMFSIFQTSLQVFMTTIDLLQRKERRRGQGWGIFYTKACTHTHTHQVTCIITQCHTVSGGSFPNISISALCICSAVPSKNLPQVAVNSVSPNNKIDENYHIPSTQVDIQWNLLIKGTPLMRTRPTVPATYTSGTGTSRVTIMPACRKGIHSGPD